MEFLQVILLSPGPHKPCKNTHKFCAITPDSISLWEPKSDQCSLQEEDMVYLKVHGLDSRWTFGLDKTISNFENQSYIVYDHFTVSSWNAIFKIQSDVRKKWLATGVKVMERAGQR